jgi:hypothetical protein
MDNCLQLNSTKCKELRIYFGRDKIDFSNIHINGSNLEIVNHVKIMEPACQQYRLEGQQVDLFYHQTQTSKNSCVRPTLTYPDMVHRSFIAHYLIILAMLSNECNKEYFLPSTLVVATDCLRYSNSHS